MSLRFRKIIPAVFFWTDPSRSLQRRLAQYGFYLITSFASLWCSIFLCLFQTKTDRVLAGFDNAAATFWTQNAQPAIQAKQNSLTLPQNINVPMPVSKTSIDSVRFLRDGLSSDCLPYLRSQCINQQYTLNQALTNVCELSCSFLVTMELCQ